MSWKKHYRKSQKNLNNRINTIRLDLRLADDFPGFSRSFLQKYIKKVGVRVDGHLVKKPHYVLGGGENLSLPDAEELEKLLTPVSAGGNSGAAFGKDQILYSEADFFVIDKPPFITTEKIAAQFFPAHRLDKDTSGILVLAKKSATKTALQRQWQARTVKKTYIALVKGKLKPRDGAIEGGIYRSIKDGKKMALSGAPRARKAYTEYKVARYFHVGDYAGDSAGGHEFTLVHLFPKTGRTHQIRVHCAAIGHPILGDATYGDKKLNRHFEEEFGLARQFLHASELKLNHPTTKKRILFTSKFPPDLDSVLKKIATTSRRATTSRPHADR